jgi:peptidoglycan hydrolase-like protein with peptidoglycan-binding domain
MAYDNNSDYVSGTQEIHISDLVCGTLYYFQINARDAGRNNWPVNSSFTTKPCATTGVVGKIASTTTTTASPLPTGSNPHNLTIPDIILHLGSVGTGVQQLQTLLNYFGTVLAPSGAGSPGEETMYFGQRTYNALKNFQRTFGLEKVDGIYGEQTKAMIESFLN